MRYLIDTCILVRAVHVGDPRRPTAVAAVRTLKSAGEDLYIFPQNVAEFWAVCTRPAGPPSNGLGMSIRSARRLVCRFQPLFGVLLETLDVYREWLRLIDDRDVSGRRIHDVRLVAAAKAHGLDRVLTFNVADFQRYPDIEVVHPADVVVT